MGELSEAQLAGLLRYGEERRKKTRDGIINSVYKFIDIYGHKAATIEEITKSRNVSTGSIYTHFGNLDRLVIACADKKIMSLVQAGSSSTENPKDNLGRVASMISKVAAIQPGIFERLTGATDAETSTEEILPELFLHLTETVRQGQVLGEIRADLDSNVIIDTFLGAVINPFHEIADIEATQKRASIVLDGITNS
jgi:AcrR family transcriptional regulator